MKRSEPLDTKYKKLLYQEAQPLLRHNRSKQKKRSFDAATEYFKKYKTPLTDTLQSLFGTQFFARAALWLDPLSDFRNSAGLIAYANRYRDKPGFSVSGQSFLTTVHTESTNAYPDEPDPVPEYVTSTGEEVFNVHNPMNIKFDSVCWDTTRKSRTVEDSFTADGNYRLDTPQYGEFLLSKFSSVTTGSPNVAFFRTVEKRFFSDGDNQLPLYEKSVAQSTLLVDGSCTSFSGDLFVPDIDDIALTFMNDNVSDMIVKALPTNRAFNSFYNIWELRELPQIIRSIESLKVLIDKYVKSPHKLLSLDNEIANLYLAWQFGVKSTYDAFKGLMMLPERATKKMNYLIRRSNKASTSRSRRVWLGHDPDAELPTFEFHLPPGIEVLNESVERRFNIELRCVVNSTIQFPELAVPSITDREYRKLVGLEPTAQDLYNMIPFTWLIDWFGGLGAYIKIMSAIKSDDVLINYGFLTIVISEELHHQAILRVQSRDRKSVV